MDSKFFTWLKPYIEQFDNGRFFRVAFKWFYIIIGVLNLCIPFYFLYIFFNIEENPPFSLEASSFFTLFFTWLIITFVSWCSFQIWWHRSDRVFEITEEDCDFVVVPVLSNFTQTVGEWVGAWVGAAGFAIVLVGTLFMGDEGNELFDLIGLDFLQTGIVNILIMPVLGFGIMVVSRMLAELFRGVAAIANNTRQ